MKKLLSFDLQGTISNSKFSDEFWLEFIPLAYAKKHKISGHKAKMIINQEFAIAGRYDLKFYNHRIALDQLFDKWDFSEIVEQLKHTPELDKDLLYRISRYREHALVIIISSTTRDFIQYELGPATANFDYLFSAIDDFNLPGKPKELFAKISNRYKIPEHNCLHIGDNEEMDVVNANMAGWNSYYYKFKSKKSKLFSIIDAHLLD